MTATPDAKADAPEFTLPGEGETKLIERTRVRVECGECGEPATKRHTFLLPNARRNSASAAYGRDDCSWCSDHEAFTCEDCVRPRPDGFEWCSTFSLAPGSARFASMFLRWRDRELQTPAGADERLALNLRAFAHSRGAPRRDDDEEDALDAARSILPALKSA